MIDEWDERQVCPDGACVGVIAADGRCKVCGKLAPSEGGAYREAPATMATADDDARPIAESAAEPTESDGEWGDRKLCSDGACVGVIGSDGRCKQCGKAAA
jgi:hypothetical protein